MFEGIPTHQPVFPKSFQVDLSPSIHWFYRGNHGLGCFLFVFVHPYLGDDLIWRAYFSNGLVQPPSSGEFLVQFRCEINNKLVTFCEMEITTKNHTFSMEELPFWNHTFSGYQCQLPECFNLWNPQPLPLIHVCSISTYMFGCFSWYIYNYFPTVCWFWQLRYELVGKSYQSFHRIP